MPSHTKPELTGFPCMITTGNIFSANELDSLIRVGEDRAAPATISGGVSDASIRRSSVHWLKRSEGFGWVYDRLKPAIVQVNAKNFGFEITSFQTSIQLTRYEESQKGFYTWHMDTGPKNATRKLSFSMQVSPPEAYDGGDLEIFHTARPRKAPRDRGTLVAFPSWAMHRVTPVTRGVRYSLVAWIAGPRWR